MIDPARGWPTAPTRACRCKCHRRPICTQTQLNTNTWLTDRQTTQTDRLTSRQNHRQIDRQTDDIPTDNRLSLTSDDYRQTDSQRGRTDRQSGRTDRPIEHLRVYLSLSQSAWHTQSMAIGLTGSLALSVTISMSPVSWFVSLTRSVSRTRSVAPHTKS
jgi:hypothetical protein